MTMPTLLFAVVVVGLIGNVIAGGEYCMYNTFYFILLSSLIFLITKTCPCNIQIFKVVKNENFQYIFFYIFLNFAQNIDCGYTLEPPR